MRERSSRRADIDGLRALAIVLVVVYHVWFGRVSGGVDVFLLISAYFMTASFARRAAVGSTEPLFTYWVRRFARLLPAAAITILGVLIAAALAFPASSWQEMWRQSWASLLYFQNWELLASASDYYDRDNVSPLQHFWSLSMQGQVFIIWPLLMIAAAAAPRASSMRLTRALALLFGGTFILSLTYSVIATELNQQTAYFDSFARLWEFALGSLLALVVPHVRLRRSWAFVLGWLGVAGIVMCGAVLDVQAGFPGYIALWPTLSAAAVILAGSARSPGGATRLLGSPLLQRLSAISYSLYLVHWPILVIWLVVTRRTSVGLLGGAFIIAASLVLAVLITYAIERPPHRYATDVRRSGLVVTASLLTVVVPLVTWQGVEAYRAALPVGEHPGAQVLMAGGDTLPVSVDAILPFGSAIESEWVILGSSCTGVRAPRQAALADTCYERAPDWRSTATVLVIGDSHAQQWMGALLPLAAQENWTVVALLKGGCAFASDEPAPAGCAQWRTAALAYALELQPDLVFAMATKTVPESPDERLLRGLDRVIDPIAAAGTEVVLLRDNPRFDIDMFACIELEGATSDTCRRSADSVLAQTNPAAQLIDDRVTVVDLTPYLCPQGSCESVIGAVAVYLDHDHLGGTYAATLSRALATEAAESLERLRR